ncbi:peroxisome biogenesis factor 10 [Cladorrhinum samala]|uniref:RING-type E3 ubiquitin transferase n=1 Tax=Cladorrhinum samala TaxID=585594 RepID=A0AAV9HKN1_9PEZI|nr:peroxisome biogenesis factor 10 [Cladorrhinum samala]
MSQQQPPSSRPPPALTTSSPYPFAFAPDIIRAHQKDAYFQGVLTNQLSDLHRRLRGARSAHAWSNETRTLADLLYLSLTTLIGNRTLGEEYCDLVQVESPLPAIFSAALSSSSSSSSTDLSSGLPPSEDGHIITFPATIDNSQHGSGPILPSLRRRAGYVLTSILAPYVYSRLAPKIRSGLRARISARLADLTRRGKDESRDKKGSLSFEYRLLRYLLAHLTSLTSGSHIQAVTLAVFYFTGAYYSLSKRLFGLRYVFTHKVDPQNGGNRGGYEVLGVLLVVQMVVRGWIHLRQQLISPAAAHQFNEDDEDGEGDDEDEEEYRERAALFGGDVNVSLDQNAYSSNNELLSGGSGSGSNQRSMVQIGITTHTPVMKGGRARVDLGVAERNKGGSSSSSALKMMMPMAWIKGAQQRKCTLCLEEMKDPAATSCGHVFCWVCIGDWVREKPECPLCRREALAQHILPLRSA